MPLSTLPGFTTDADLTSQIINAVRQATQFVPFVVGRGTWIANLRGLVLAKAASAHRVDRKVDI